MKEFARVVVAVVLFLPALLWAIIRGDDGWPPFSWPWHRREP